MKHMTAYAYNKLYVEMLERVVKTMQRSSSMITTDVTLALKCEKSDVAHELADELAALIAQWIQEDRFGGVNFSLKTESLGLTEIYANTREATKKR